METLPRHTRLQRRGARYYFRAKVPADLREAIGKREIREALNTSDPRQAVRLVRRRSVAVDELFAMHRRRLQLNSTAPVLATAADVERIVFKWLHEQERARDAQEPNWLEAEQVLRVLNEDEAELSAGVNETVGPALQQTADVLLKENGWIAFAIPLAAFIDPLWLFMTDTFCQT